MPFTYFAQWWAWMLRGVLAVLFGLFTFVVPGFTLALLVLIFGIWVFIDGMTHLSLALRAEAWHPWLHTLEGLIGVCAGVIALFYPMETMLAMIYVIAGWAILTGMVRLALSIHLRSMPSREWLIGLSAVLAVIFGLVLVWAPSRFAMVIALAIGVYAIVAGLVFISLAMRMRRLHRLLTEGL